MSHRPTEIAAALSHLNDDGATDESVIDLLFCAAYGELREIAARLMGRERNDHTLEPTALVNEAFLRLADGASLDWRGRAHFLGIAGRAMRQVLVEHARRRQTAKRGHGWERVTLSGLAGTVSPAFDLLDLDAALSRLAARDGRIAHVAELRIFAGLTVEEIAGILGTSKRTVDSDWAFAKPWLVRELTDGPVD